MARPIITYARLREVLHYNPDTGVFTWRARTSNRVLVGDVAGTACSEGYIQVRVDGRLYLAHRLAHLYMTGEWPPADVDHKFGNRQDNRWSEIRPATTSENMQNKRRAQRNNKCGLLGVSMFRGKARAVIYLHGKQKYIGEFDTPELAYAAYLDAKAKLHPFQTLVEKTCSN